MRYIILGNGRKVTLGSYVYAWKATRALYVLRGGDAPTLNNPDDPGAQYSVSAALLAFRAAAQARLRARTLSQTGRKHSDDWQAAMRFVAHRVNNRARIREADAPVELRSRLAHKFYGSEL